MHCLLDRLDRLDRDTLDLEKGRQNLWEDRFQEAGCSVGVRGKEVKGQLDSRLIRALEQFVTDRKTK